jgi:enhancing lycopene biosynthesis protein 2
MSIFVQEVLGLLNRNKKKVTLDKVKDYFEFGKLYNSSSLNNKSAYTPQMEPFVIKWGDFICQATEDMTRTLPGEGKLGYIPVYTDPSGYCNWDTLKDSIITQNALNTIINIAGSLQVLGDVQISGGDLTATTSTFNLLNTAPVSVINFGSTTTNIEVGGAATVVNINGTADSTSCTTGALVVDGGVGIAKNLFVCGDATISGDAAINGGDLTSTATTFNLLGQSTNINFGSNSENIIVGSANSTSDVTIIGTQDSTSCTTGALVINGGVGIAKNLNLCGILSINNTTQSTDCTTGALVIAGGVGIAKNLNVCEDLTVQGITYLNGNVNLGNSIADDIRLYGQLIDNNGNGPLPNQVLVGQAGGIALWQNDDIVETLTYGSLWQGNASNVKQELPIGTADQILISDGITFAWQNNPAAIVGEVCAVNSIPLWTPNSNTLGCSLIYQDGNSSTPATKIFLKGGLASETSQVRTITDVALGYGNYAGGENSAAFNFRSSALGNDSFALGHKSIAGGHSSLAAGFNTGAGNYAFGYFNTTVTSTTLDIFILSGTMLVGDFIVANVENDPSVRHEILTIVGTGTIGLNTITIATPISVNIGEAVAIEEAIPNRGDSQGAIALGVTAASKGVGAIAIGSRASTDIPNQIAIGSDFTTVKLDGTVQNDTQNKLLVIDANNVVRWRDASTITATITANNGLTMSTASNVQLGGTLIQDTNIFTADYRIRLSSNNVATNPVIIIDALSTASSAHGIRIDSIGGFAGYFESTSGLGAIFADNSGTSPAVTFQQSNGQVVGKFTRLGSNNTGIDNILDLYNTCTSGPAVVGLGAAINFNIEDNLSVPSNAGSIFFDWTSFASGNSSRFVVKTVGFGISSNQLEVSNEGLLTLNSYGSGAFYDPGNVVNYTLGAKASGEIVEVPFQALPKTFTALITQSGLTAPTMQILQDFPGGITWTWSYVSPGLYALDASQPIFLANNTAVYIIPDVSAGKPYCAAIERQSDTALLINSFVPNSGASDNSCFDRATLKIEIYP